MFSFPRKSVQHTGKSSIGTASPKTAGLRTCLDIRHAFPTIVSGLKRCLPKSYRDLPQRDCPGFTPGSLLMANGQPLSPAKLQILFLICKSISHLIQQTQVSITCFKLSTNTPPTTSITDNHIDYQFINQTIETIKTIQKLRFFV